MPGMGVLAFGAALLAVTFASGVAVGRHWARQPLVLASESATPPTGGPKRAGVPDAETDRARGREDKLTFYRTLTAPLGPGPAAAPAAGTAHGASRPRAAEERPAASRETPRIDTRSLAAPSAAAPAGRSATTGALVAATGAAGAPASAWAVQVGVFRGKEQAERAHRRLVEGGLQASLTQTMVDGETRYRVRAGSYPTRAEAERAAERVRADRALPTYITLN